MQYVIDATDQRLGRLASKIALMLQGKLQSTYAPRLPGGDSVVVKNAQHIVVTGKKTTQKIYYRHTGYMGHLREKSYEQVFKAAPSEVLRRAVYNMLPKNKLRRLRLRHLTIES